MTRQDKKDKNDETDNDKTNNDDTKQQGREGNKERVTRRGCSGTCHKGYWNVVEGQVRQDLANSHHLRDLPPHHAQSETQSVSVCVWGKEKE